MMKPFLFFTVAVVAFSLSAASAQFESHEGTYQKNLTYKGSITGNEILYTLYLPPDHSRMQALILSSSFSMGPGEGILHSKSCRAMRPRERQA